jgi:hypothetical protein
MNALLPPARQAFVTRHVIPLESVCVSLITPRLCSQFQRRRTGNYGGDTLKASPTSYTRRRKTMGRRLALPLRITVVLLTVKLLATMMESLKRTAVKILLDFREKGRFAASFDSDLQPGRLMRHDCLLCLFEGSSGAHTI